MDRIEPIGRDGARPAGAKAVRIVAAFMSPLADATPTGGQRYNLRLMEAWSKLAVVSFASVRYRWIRLGAWGPALLCFHLGLLRRAQFVFQDAANPRVSPWLIRACRYLFPHVKHVGTVHHPLWLERPEVREQECKFFNSYDYLITVSRHGLARLRREGIRPPIYLLPPGRAKMPARMTPQADPPLILWNGYLLARKGPMTLLDALERLRHPGWQAHFIVSSLPSPEFDRQFHRRLAGMAATLRHRILVSNHLPIEEFRVQFFRASIFCLPSLVEGYSISTAEAMACGCAVVVPRTENFLELLGTADYAGFYDPEDPADLARQLDRLLADAALRQAAGAYCLDRSTHLPDWEQFDVRACDLLRQIVPGAGEPRGR